MRSSVPESTHDALWMDGEPPVEHFDPGVLSGLPDGAQRYLRRSIAPGTPLFRAVRFRLQGRLYVAGRWHRFEGVEVLRPERGFDFRANVRFFGLPLPGLDSCIDGQAHLEWKLFGAIPVVRSAGPKVDRSALGRLHLERIWLPTSLVHCPWTEHDPRKISAPIESHGLRTELFVALDSNDDAMAIWGERHRDDDPSHVDVFGGRASAWADWAGVRIPTQLRLGWGFGTERFEKGGVFFEASLDEVEFR